MKRNIYFKMLALPLLLSLVLAGCTSQYDMGVKRYHRLAYHDAIPHLEKAVERGENPQALVYLAESYRKINNYPMALETYEKVVSRANSEPKHLLAYGELLKNAKQYNQAKRWLTSYLVMEPDDRRARNMLQACDSVAAYRDRAFLYTVEPLRINSEEPSYSPMFFGDALVFCSQRAKLLEPESPWSGYAFTDLYIAYRSSNGGFMDPDIFAPDLESNYHEGPVAFNAEGNTMYFTRSDYMDRQVGKDSNDVNHLKLMVAELDDDYEWENLREMDLNMQGTSTGHPALSADGNWLYFTSDRNSGYGKTDIYVSRKMGNSWGDPMNIGVNVNTEGNEMFPTLYDAPDGKQYLYFASDGHRGLGGLDIYYTEIFNGKPGEIRHIDAPINSAYDDFGIILYKAGNAGFFSSNRRTENHLADEIFSFTRISPNLVVRGKVIDKDTRQPLSYSRVLLTNLHSVDQNADITDENGEFMFDLRFQQPYSLMARKVDYSPELELIAEQPIQESETLEVVIELDPLEIGKTFELENIYYDFDESYIRPDARGDLNDLIDLMNENPGMVIELSSHTDCRGNDKYNEKLSTRRAKAAVQYMITRGISRKRMKAKGYGEYRLKNDCDCSDGPNGPGCSEEQHQENRRTEFSILKM